MTEQTNDALATDIRASLTRLNELLVVAHEGGLKLAISIPSVEFTEPVQIEIQLWKPL